jgi:hypothetical protein
VRFGDPIEPPDSIQDPEQTYSQITEKLRHRVVEMWEGLRAKQNHPEEVAAGD